MGIVISKALAKIFRRKQKVQILMVGLDAAGKTTILYQLRLGATQTTVATIGFNVETVEYRNIRFNIWDVGGQESIRPLWRHYYFGTQAVIFVVDSSDRARIKEAKHELFNILQDAEMTSSIVLVFANKQDLPSAVPLEEVTQKMELHRLQGRTWHIAGSCALTGEGLTEGLEWLAANLPKG